MFIIHPYLFSISPLLYLLHSAKSYNSMLALLLIAISNIILIYIILCICKANKINLKKSAFILSCLLLWLFSYEPARIAFHQISKSVLYKNIYFIFLWLSILIMLIISISIINIKFDKYNRFLNIFAILLIIIQILTLYVNTINISKEKYEIKEMKFIDYHYKKSSLRDIYYIVLDEYPGFTKTQEIMHFENNEIYNYLKNKGFYVSKDSYANYSNTAYAMSCYLNMQYHEIINTQNNSHMISTIKPNIPYGRLIERNQIALYLESLGYSNIRLVDYYTEIDINYMNWYNNNNLYYCIKEFIIKFMKLTIIRKPIITNYIESTEKKQLIKQQVERSYNIIKESGPKFVYIHFQLPHDPYVYNEKGENNSFVEMITQKKTNIKLLQKQIIYCNYVIKELVNRILVDSEKKPIIIIQSDHGPREIGKNIEEERRFTLSILNAYYFPDGGDRYLYSTITPVNTFRLMLNYYFEQNLPLLKDENYYSYYTSPKLINMTDQLRQHH